MSERPGDGLEKLARQLYGRPPAAGEYLGGSNAKILSDAAAEIIKLRAQVARLEGEAKQGGFSW